MCEWEKRWKGRATTNSLGAGVLDGLEDSVDTEVGLGRGRLAHTDGLVCESDMEGVAVDVRMDGHRRDSHRSRRLDNTACNFA